VTTAFLVADEQSDLIIAVRAQPVLVQERHPCGDQANKPLV
jgi:hypothetical protein